jgi:hypothetical protein
MTRMLRGRRGIGERMASLLLVKRQTPSHLGALSNAHFAEGYRDRETVTDPGYTHKVKKGDRLILC